MILDSKRVFVLTPRASTVAVTTRSIGTVHRAHVVCILSAVICLDDQAQLGRRDLDYVKTHLSSGLLHLHSDYVLLPV
jgi:hypothetical protein